MKVVLREVHVWGYVKNEPQIGRDPPKIFSRGVANQFLDVEVRIC